MTGGQQPPPGGDGGGGVVVASLPRSKGGFDGMKALSFDHLAMMSCSDVARRDAAKAGW